MNYRVYVDIPEGEANGYKPIGFCEGAHKGYVKACERLLIWNALVSWVNQKRRIGVIWRVFAAENYVIVIGTPVDGAVKLYDGNGGRGEKLVLVELEDMAFVEGFKAPVKGLQALLLPLIPESINFPKGAFYDEVVVGCEDDERVVFKVVVFEKTKEHIESLVGFKRVELFEYEGFELGKKNVGCSRNSVELFKSFSPKSVEIIKVPIMSSFKDEINKTFIYIACCFKDTKNLFYIKISGTFGFEEAYDDIEKKFSIAVCWGKIGEKTLCCGQSEGLGCASTEEENMRLHISFLLIPAGSGVGVFSNHGWDFIDELEKELKEVVSLLGFGFAGFYLVDSLISELSYDVSPIGKLSSYQAFFISLLDGVKKGVFVGFYTDVNKGEFEGRPDKAYLGEGLSHFLNLFNKAVNLVWIRFVGWRLLGLGIGYVFPRENSAIFPCFNILLSLNPFFCRQVEDGNKRFLTVGALYKGVNGIGFIINLFVIGNCRNIVVCLVVAMRAFAFKTKHITPWRLR